MQMMKKKAIWNVVIHKVFGVKFVSAGKKKKKQKKSEE